MLIDLLECLHTQQASDVCPGFFAQCQRRLGPRRDKQLVYRETNEPAGCKADVEAINCEPASL